MTNLQMLSWNFNWCRCCSFMLLKKVVVVVFVEWCCRDICRPPYFSVVSQPPPHPPRTSTHPPSSRRHFRSRKTGNTGGEYLYNNCFLRFLFTNEKTEVKLLFFVSCTKRKKPKNGSRIAFSVLFVQDQKRKKTEVELLFPFFVHGEKKLMKRKWTCFLRLLQLMWKKKVHKCKCLYRFSR